MNAPPPSALHAGTARNAGWLQAEYSTTLLYGLLAAITLVRIVGLAVSNAELYFDEAQYWAWAQEPAFGYFTKPPLIAWLIGGATALCGDTPFCVRLPSPLLHAVTALVLHAVALKLFSRPVAFWAALVYVLMPGTSVSSMLISTDVPLLFFWSLALLALVHHVERPSLLAGLGMGVAIGLGLNAKYAMAFFLACYALYAVVSPRGRASLRHPGTWLALAVALALIAPNLLWNAEHRFATFEHTADDAAWGGRFPNILGLLAFLGIQVAILGPVPFAAFALTFGRRTIAGLSGETRKFLLAGALPVFALIGMQALISKANGNWAATGFPAAAVLAAAVMVLLDWRRGMIATLAVSAIAFLSITFAGTLAGTYTSGPAGRELNKLAGWGTFAARINSLAQANGVNSVVFVGRGLTASMLYELRDSELDIHAFATDPERPQDHFEMTRPWSWADKGPVLLVGVGGTVPQFGSRAKLVEHFKTDIFVARRYGGMAYVLRVD